MTEELELLTPPPQAAPASGRVGLPAATLVYSSDGRYVFQRQAHVVRVLHAQSGRVLHECVRVGNKSAVRALALHPHNALQLLAAYEDGHIIVWDFVEHKPLTELDAKAPCCGWRPAVRVRRSFCWSSRPTRTPGASWSSVSRRRSAAVCCSRTASGSFRPPRCRATRRHRVTGNRLFRGLSSGGGRRQAGHTVATHQPGGKDSGNRVYTMQKSTTSVTSRRRAYLPRLPAPVEVIAPRQTAACTPWAWLTAYSSSTTRDARTGVGGARTGACRQFGRQLAADAPIGSRPAVEGARTQWSSGAGVLQFYEPFADRVLQTLLLSERNQVTRTEDEVLPTLRASHSCFSSRGGDLVTLHAPTTAKHGDEQALRFWTRRVDGPFFVNTAIDAPHGRARVTSMTYSPSQTEDCMVTADEQGDFKVWQKTATEAGGASWHCQAVVRFRDEPVTAVGFARDGSLLAVAYGNKLTLWVATHSLRRVIPSCRRPDHYPDRFPGYQLAGAVVAEESLYERFGLAASGRREEENAGAGFDAQTPVPTCVRVVDLDSKVWSAGFHPGTGDIVLLDNNTGVWRLDGLRPGLGRPAPETGSRCRRGRARRGQGRRTGGQGSERDLQCRQWRSSSEKKTSHAHAGPHGVAVNGSASFMDTMLPKPHQVVEADESFKNVHGEASTSQKKKNKRRKKQQQQQTTTDPIVNDNGEQRKRMKLQVEKELANTELQQQTYSKLLETFRYSKARRA
ncbi:WD40 repeat, conserved site [Phytophthora cactorum]|nr:WD40 repeat, conserved site [Phytophthora cactorum]